MDAGRFSRTALPGRSQRGLPPMVWILAAIFLAGGCGDRAVTVPNPDYQAWSSFQPGSYTVFEGTQITGELQRPIRITERLIAANSQRVILERTIMHLDTNELVCQPARRVEPARIGPKDDPRTHPAVIVTELPAQQLDIAGQSFICLGHEMRVHSKLEGFCPTVQNVQIRAYTNNGIPGRLARIVLSARTANHRFEITGQVVRFHAEAEQEGQ